MVAFSLNFIKLINFLCIFPKILLLKLCPRIRNLLERESHLTGAIPFMNCRNCLRRIIHDDQEFSHQSIINVIERFVKTVNLMEETILIPSRLMDRQVKQILKFLTLNDSMTYSFVYTA